MKNQLNINDLAYTIDTRDNTIIKGKVIGIVLLEDQDIEYIRYTIKTDQNKTYSRAQDSIFKTETSLRTRFGHMLK